MKTSSVVGHTSHLTIPHMAALVPLLPAVRLPPDVASARPTPAPSPVAVALASREDAVEWAMRLEASADAYHTMRTYKTQLCPITEPHDPTLCEYVHPGERYRRDPFAYVYSVKACNAFRKHDVCNKGDACPDAHGVLEVGLHPSRYRTKPCSLCETGQEHCGRPGAHAGRPPRAD